MKLIADCSQVNITEWHELMKYTRPCSGRVLRNKIKKHLPELYNAFVFEFFKSIRKSGT